MPFVNAVVMESTDPSDVSDVSLFVTAVSRTKSWPEFSDDAFINACQDIELSELCTIS